MKNGQLKNQFDTSFLRCISIIIISFQFLLKIKYTIIYK